jgi:uncharacterized protein
MNKSAAKEPSMDEILSSIRQIISDDDAGAVPESAESEPAGGVDDLPSFDAFLADEEDEAQSEPEPEPAFEPEPEPEPEEHEPLVPSLSEMVEESDEALALSLDQVIAEEETVEDAPEEDFALPDDVAFVGEDSAEPEPPAPEPPSARIDTMPDPALSDDLAEHLLDSTAQAAASNAFSRLGVMSLGAGNQTIEGVVRELLRPMLKAWLDENLPSVVERLVEREIERVSRGGR